MTTAPSTPPDRGGCGDPRRGAAMGRGSFGTPTGKVWLSRIHLDDGGYDPGGTYWSIGTPLYEAYDDAGTFYVTSRASSIEAARDELTRMFRGLGPNYPHFEFVIRVEQTAAMRAFTDAYIKALIWSGEESLMRMSEDDLDPETRAEIEKDCAEFYNANAADIGEHAESAGHDYALTRNRHGVGFWDRPEIWPGEVGKRLTRAAHARGEANLYLGDDGKLRLE